jgi:hypothetical protein
MLAAMEADPGLNVRDYDRLLKAQERETGVPGQSRHPYADQPAVAAHDT